MRILNTVVGCALALSMAQAAFATDGVGATISSPFITSTGLGCTTAVDAAKAERLGLDAADIQAIRLGHMTENIRAISNGKPDAEVLNILQDEFGRAD